MFNPYYPNYPYQNYAQNYQNCAQNLERGKFALLRRMLQQHLNHIADASKMVTPWRHYNYIVK